METELGRDVIVAASPDSAVPTQATGLTMAHAGVDTNRRDVRQRDNAGVAADFHTHTDSETDFHFESVIPGTFATLLDYVESTISQK